MFARDRPGSPVRLDTWLWAARFFKTRALAARAIEGGKVQLNGQRPKRSKHVAAGDRLRIRKGPYEFLVEVRGLSERRGPASQARTLYEETPESVRARQRVAAQQRAQPIPVYQGKGRPTKRDRRAIERARRDLDRG